MKAIIQRGLSLNTTYILTEKKYIPIEQSAGAYCCDNCGKLIANIATVKNADGNSFNIGFDCLETILINNSLLSSGDILEYEKAKKMIPKILRFAKTIKETLINNSQVNITGLNFEMQNYPSDFYPFTWLKNNETTSRDNTYVKLKDVQIEFVLSTLRNIFPQLTFLYN